MFFSKIIEKKFDAVLGRYELNPTQIYFASKEDLGVKKEEYNVKGNHGDLKGFFYYEKELDPKKLIIFDHGIGAGHLAYFKEIETLVKKGYTVYSYDHTGCANSDGEGILGFAQAVNDLDHVISAIHLDNRFWDTDIKLMGHSWGGYSVMNVVAFHPEVTHVVSLAGFLSARALIEQYLPKFVLHYSDEVMDREREHNPMYADLDARESMKKSEAKLFFLQSKDDTLVKFDRCFTLLKAALGNRENTILGSYNHKWHHPQRTEAAAVEDLALREKWMKLIKKKNISVKEQTDFSLPQDWKTIVQQDEKVWNDILAFLES